MADEITLAPKGKSVVVYGPNGAGKSTFPDALEYLLTGGKIGHIQHEYSGTKLERAVRNTRAPDKEPAQIKLKLAEGLDESLLIPDSVAIRGASPAQRRAQT